MRHRLIPVRLFFLPLLFAAVNDGYGQSWKAWSDSAQEYYTSRNYSDARRLFQRALEGLGDSVRTSAGVVVLRGVAKSNYVLGRWDTALGYYQRERELLARLVGREDSDYATNAIMIGSCYGQVKDNDHALPYFVEARAIREKLYSRNSVQYAEACVTIANAEFTKGDNEPAADQYREARGILERLGRTATPTYASCCNGLCNVYLRMGDYEQAEPMAVSTLEVRGKLYPHDQPPYALSCMTLANFYVAIGQYDKAEPLFREAMAIRERAYTRGHPAYIESAVALADLYYRMRRYAEAEGLYREAKGWMDAQANVDRSTYAMVCNNFANLYIAESKWREAKDVEEQAGAIWTALGLPPEDPNHAIHASTLGAAELGLGEYSAALQSFTRAGALWKTQLGQDHPYYINNEQYLAQVNRALGKVDVARELYAAALRARMKVAEKVFQFTNEKEKAAYLESTSGAEDEYYSLLWGANAGAGDAYDIALADRNMILTASRHIRDVVNRSGDSALITIYRRWTNEKRVLAGLYSAGRPDAAQLKAVEDSADVLEKRLTRGAEGLLPLFLEPTVDWKEIRKKLAPGEAAVEYIAFRYFNGIAYADSVLYAALVLRKDRAQPVLVRLCAQRGVDSLLSRSGRFLVAGRGAGTKSNGGGDYSRALYGLLWAPLERELAGIRTVYFAPAGTLYRVSFAALPIGGDSVLSDRYRLEQVVQTGDLVTGRRMAGKAGDKICVYGGVDYMGGGKFGGGRLGAGMASWASLPGTEVEADRIRAYGEAKGMRVTVLRGAAATEESIKALDGQNWPAVLHIASHGFCYATADTATAAAITADTASANGATAAAATANPAPGAVYRTARDPLMRSGIVLAGGNFGWNGMAPPGHDDGILTAYEISNLYLPAVRLVVLSACETALGEIRGTEGVYGLARAFRMAGVPNLVMSLWTVPDGPTAEFMSSFYAGLFAGEDVDVAFLEAQNNMKALYKKQPENWAAWILVR